LLTGIGLVYFKLGTLDFVQFQLTQLAKTDQILIFGLFFGGFAAKIPLIPLHLWLPEAHVEAPTVGSVFLAAVLLKLGTYGVYRTVFSICDFETLSAIKPIVIPFLLVSLISSSLSAIRQIDIKKIVAYSSVAHMSFSLLGLFSMNQFGIVGFLFLMIAHGLISASMFFAVGMLYDRFHTRNVMYYGGLVQFMPIFSVLYFITIFSNLSMPGTCNFVGELFVLYSVWPMSGIPTIVITLLGLFLVVMFSLILLYRILFYQISSLLATNLIDVTIREFLILGILNLYIIIFGLKPDVLINFLQVANFN